LAMEKRKFPRLAVSLPIQYHVRSPDSGEYVGGKGMLKNISQGGMYFNCPPPLPLQDGDMGDFVIDTTASNIQYHPRMKVSGRVVRIESPGINSAEYGIAIQFLSVLTLELRS
jgi:hypothetical protein